MKFFKNVMVQTGLLSGSVAGVMGIVLFLTLYLMGVGLVDSVFRVDFIIPLPFLIFSLYYFRKRSSELRIWQGLIIGAVTVCVFAFLYLSFITLFMNVVDTDFLQKTIQIRIDEIEVMKIAMGKNEEYREEYFEKYPIQLNAAKSLTISSIIFFKAQWYIFAGALYTIFMSLLFRK